MSQEMKRESPAKERGRKQKLDIETGAVRSLYTWKRGQDANHTGIPDGMREKFESLYGTFLGDVRVHYGSARPAALSARAYTQGSQVFIGPGEESCLPHELGHVIQQKKGTVRATGSVGGLPLNDDPVFEQQADRIQAEVGAWTAGTVRREALAYGAGTESGYAPPVVQRVLFTDIPADEKLSGVTDLGIWWAMAAEWHEQGLRAKESEKTGPEKGAKDYIKSLANYVSTASRPAVTLEDGDEARILTHGIDPDRIEKMNKRQYDDLLIMFHAHPNWLNCLEQIKEAELKKAIGLVGQNMPYVLNQVEVQRQANGVDQLVTNIEDALTAGGNSQSVIPAYCYMGNNASDHKERTKRRGETSSLGQGGILSPVSGIVSLNKGNMSSLVNYLQIKYHSSSPQWKDIIFAEEKKFGSWKDINGLCSANGTVKTAWDRLKAWEASSAPDAGELAQFLEILYEVIKPQYEAFLADILQYDSKKSNAGDKVLTGKIPGLWPLSQAELEGEA